MKRYVPFLALLLALSVSVEAQAQFDLGAHVGYNLGDEPFDALFIGVDGRFALGALQFPVVLAPSIQYFFLDDFEGFGQSVSQSLIEIDLNALYEIGIENQAFTPYVGAGLGIGRYSVDVETGIIGSVDLSSTDIGLNILGGAVFGFGPLRPYAQARFMLGGAELITLQGGILYRLGG